MLKIEDVEVKTEQRPECRAIEIKVGVLIQNVKMISDIEYGRNSQLQSHVVEQAKAEIWDHLYGELRGDVFRLMNQADDPAAIYDGLRALAAKLKCK